MDKALKHIVSVNCEISKTNITRSTTTSTPYMFRNSDNGPQPHPPQEAQKIKYAVPKTDLKRCMPLSQWLHRGIKPKGLWLKRCSITSYFLFVYLEGKATIFSHKIERCSENVTKTYQKKPHAFTATRICSLWVNFSRLRRNYKKK